MEKVVCEKLSPKDLFGRMGPRPDCLPSGFGFVPGPAVDLIENGGILLLDEYNASTVDLRVRLRDLFDAVAHGSREFLLKEDTGTPGGRRLKVHEAFRAITT